MADVKIGVLVIEIMEHSATQWRWLLNDRPGNTGAATRTWGGMALSADAAFRKAMTMRSLVLSGEVA